MAEIHATLRCPPGTGVPMVHTVIAEPVGVDGAVPFSAGMGGESHWTVHVRIGCWYEHHDAELLPEPTVAVGFMACALVLAVLHLFWRVDA